MTNLIDDRELLPLFKRLDPKIVLFHIMPNPETLEEDTSTLHDTHQVKALWSSIKLRNGLRLSKLLE